MRFLLRPFTEHPASVDESYGEHLVFAGGFGFRLILAGLACLVHGLFPFLFARTASREVQVLHHRLESGNRSQLIDPSLPGLEGQ